MKRSPSVLALVAFFLLVFYQPPLFGGEAGGDSRHGDENMIVPETGIYYLEIVTPDPQAARDFYGQAYGWEFSDATPELGNAYFASLPNGSLWGIRGPLRDSEDPIVRTYLRVDDIHQATKKAEELGATIALGPTEIAGRGQIAIYLLGGIEQGIWQVP